MTRPSQTSMVDSWSPRRTGRCRVAWTVVALVALALSLPALPAFAQQAPEAEPPRPEVEVEGDASEAPAAPPAGVEMMKVKGRAVSGIETDVPQSLTQFDAATIDALGAANIADLAKVTPNVEIRTAGSTTATFFIRGVGLSDFSSNAAGAVGIYQDDIQLNAPAVQLGAIFDVEDVAVERGPQGYGLFRNASAGAIRMFSNKPTGEYAARLQTTVGSIWSDDARDALRVETKGFLNVPLVEDMLAARIAFQFADSDPYIENGCAGAPDLTDRIPFISSGGNTNLDEASICGEVPLSGRVSSVPSGLEKWLGEEERWSLRGSMRLSPPESDVDLLMMVHGSRLDQDSTVGEFIGTTLVTVDTATGQQVSRFGAPALSSNYQPREQREEYEDLVEEISGFDIETFEDVSIPLPVDRSEVIAEAFEELGKNLAEDRPLDREPYRGDFNKTGRTTLDRVGGFLRAEFSVGEDIDSILTLGTEHYERFRDQDTDFSPARIFEGVTTDTAKQVTLDSTFAGDVFDGAVRWKVGNAAVFERLTNETYTDVGRNDPVRRRFVQNTSAFITTAQAAWDFLEDFTIEAGIRWNYETKDFRIQERILLGFGEIDRQRQKSWQEPTGGISLTYHLTDETTIYSKYTRGFKVGHFNGNNGQELFDPGPARPEFIDSFEWGLSMSLLDGRFSARGGFFFYRYNDYQVFIFRDNPNENPSLVIRNAEQVQQLGAELGVKITPLKDYVPEEYQDLTITLDFGWLDSEFLEFTNVVFRQDPQTLRQFPLTIDYRGNSLINSPEFKLSGSVEWKFDLSEWGTITPRYDFAWSDDIFFDPTEGRGSLDRTGNPIQPEFALGQPAHIIHNVRLSYGTAAGNVEVSGWVRNILDTRVKRFAFDATFFAGQVLNFVDPPRTAGVDLTISW